MTKLKYSKHLTHSIFRRSQFHATRPNGLVSARPQIRKLCLDFSPKRLQDMGNAQQFSRNRNVVEPLFMTILSLAEPSLDTATRNSERRNVCPLDR